MPDELADLKKQVACLSRSAAQRSCSELGLPSTGSGKHCRQRLVECFFAAPREIVRLGRTFGVWGVNHETIKKRYKDPVVRAIR